MTDETIVNYQDRPLFDLTNNEYQALNRTEREPSNSEPDRKQELYEIIKRKISKHPWAKDAARLAYMLENTAETINGGHFCAIDSASWITAWKEMNMKGKPTYKAIHALPGKAIFKEETCSEQPTSPT